MEFYLGQILFFGGNFAQRNFMLCAGQILGISQNTALFSILGTTYGGNGQTTFALPDARGRVWIGAGAGPGLTPRSIGETSGTEANTISSNEMPMHVHPLAGGTVALQAMSGATVDDETDAPQPGAFLGTPISASPVAFYVPAGTAGTTAVPLGGLSLQGTCSPAGGSTPMNNMQPYQTVNAIICVQGLFPSRN